MKKIDIMDIKAKVIASAFGIAAEDELTLLQRLESLLLDGISMGMDVMASRCEAAEQIITKLTMDNNSTPNYLQGYEMAQIHFQDFPNSATSNRIKEELTQPNPIFPIARVLIERDAIVKAEMCSPGLPDGEHLLYPVLVDANARPISTT